jgi:hypothetical protein
VPLMPLITPFAVVAPSRRPEFFQEIQDAFTQAGDEDIVQAAYREVAGG